MIKKQLIISTIRKNNNNNELDKTDEQIIRLLQQNARLSNKQIAAEVGIAESTCSERMRKLNKKKNILTVFMLLLIPLNLAPI